MSIFDGLFRSRDKPQNRTAGSSYAFFMGNSIAGKSVTERSAMQMTAVYSCARILAEAVAGLPLHLYTDEKNPETESRVETVLDGHGIFYDKTEVWIESEKLYEVLYSFELEVSQ